MPSSGKNINSGKIRIGQGIDIHKFVGGRKLILGGVEIPHEKGLEGHSDADVLVHAIIDAVLGAIGQDDIGAHFPDTDERWRGANSLQMLERVISKIKGEGWRVSNIDSTVLIEKPRLRPFISAIRQSLSRVLEISEDACSVKAGTAEKLGFVGREEGVFAQCVVLLFRD